MNDVAPRAARRQGHLAQLFGVVFAVWAFLLLGTQVEARVWYLNSYGQAGKYQITRFNDAGFPFPIDPVIGPSGSGFDAAHVAWPSALRIAGRTFLFASGNDGRRWGAVGLWTSPDGVTFRREGRVFSAAEAEPHGIGPAYVFHDPTREAPFGMYFVIRGENGPGPAIGYATSADGRSWSRHGVVLAATGDEEAAGLSVSYACRLPTGRWVLFYHGYRTLHEAVALVVTADAPEGPFTGRTVLMRGDGIEARVISGLRRTNFLVVDAAAELLIGQAYILRGEDQMSSEVVQIASIIGQHVFLTRPLLLDHAGHRMLSVMRAKIDPSFARVTRDGWEGIFTAYEPSPGVHAEYTVRVRGRSLTSPWQVVPEGIRFKPWAPELWLSAENPARLATDASCE